METRIKNDSVKGDNSNLMTKFFFTPAHIIIFPSGLLDL